MSSLTKLVEPVTLSWVDEKGVVVYKSVLGLIDSGAELEHFGGPNAFFR